MALDVGEWIGLSAFLLSAAVAYGGYRTTDVTAYRKRIDDLEEELAVAKRENEACEAELRRSRRDNDWLLGELRKNGRPL